MFVRPALDGAFTVTATSTTRRGDLLALLAEHPEVTRVNLSSNRQSPDLELLRGLTLDHVSVTAPAVLDWSALISIKGLVGMNISVGDGPQLDLRQLPALQQLAAPARVVASSVSHATGLRTLRLSGFLGESLADLAALTQLRSLDLRWSDNLTTLYGLAQVAPLEKMFLQSAPALTSLTGLPPSTRSIYVEACHAIPDLEGLARYSRLTSLTIGDCGDLTSLRPLIALPLEDIAVWGKTTVVDGDLTAVLKIPTLTQYRMDGRRHYNPRVQQVQAVIDARAAGGRSPIAASGQPAPAPPSRNPVRSDHDQDEAADLDRFWNFVDRARSAARLQAPAAPVGTDVDAVADRLRDLLSAEDPTLIRAMAQTLSDVVDAGYRWQLWGAAYVVNGGCSDDGFFDFRGWLVAQGRATYEAVLAEPDSLVDHISAGDDGLGCENMLYAARRAYEGKTGQPLRDLDAASVPPLDLSFDFEDSDTMGDHFPRLTALLARGSTESS